MSTRYTQLVPGEFYHIYNRGNSKQTIFRDESDYHHFIKLMYVANSVKPIRIRDYSKFDVKTVRIKNRLVSIGCYCLMPNHFHILLTPCSEDSASTFMLKLSTSYVMYFNKKYRRTGSLFEGAYKSKYIDSDQYLKYLFSYIHLNPIKLIQKDWQEVGIINKIKAFNYLREYKHSSFLDYMEPHTLSKNILSREDFPSYFPEAILFKKEIFEWISYKDEQSH